MTMKTSQRNPAMERTATMSRPVQLLEGVVTPRLLRELRSRECSPGGLSIYVNIDLNQWGNAEGAKIAAKNVFLDAQRDIEGRDLPADVRSSALANLARARELVMAMAGRRHTRSLAIFSDEASGYGIALPLPWPIRPRWYVGPRFVTYPLEQVLHLSERYCICLTDKDDARIFMYYMGALEERKDIHDEVPPHLRFPDPFRELEYNRKQIVYYHKHFARTAAALFELYQEEPFAHLILGGLHQLLPQFEHHLHSYLRDKVIARWDAEVQNVSPQELLQRVMEEEQKIEERHCEAIWEKIEKTGVNRSSRGPEDVFGALWRHQVHALLVDPDVTLRGNRCRSCHRLTLKDRCPECGGDVQEVPDAVMEAVGDAIETGAIVKLWAKSPELAAAGHMASLNRF